jgi:hypothetical protein
VDIQDLVEVGQHYGTSGAPTNKTYAAYDSGWINITDKCGQNITITHGLNISDWNNQNIEVSITGKTTLDGEINRNLGLTGQVYGWNQTYGVGTMSDMVQTGDGGYALAGGSWLVKTDSAGNMMWNKTYNWGSGRALVQTADGGYALVGGAGNAWLIKTDGLGNTLWNKTYGGYSATDIVQTADGGYALAGPIGLDPHPWADANPWMVKTDEAGNEMWNKTYPIGRVHLCWGYTGLLQTPDGGYVISGCVDLEPSDHMEDFFLIKIDAAGNMTWSNTYQGQNAFGLECEEGRWSLDLVPSLVQTSDGGYLLAGPSLSVWVDYWPGYDWCHCLLVKTDAAGNMMWSKGLGEMLGTEIRQTGLVQTADGGYAIGISGSSGSANIMKTDANGKLQWTRSYDGFVCYALVQTEDGGYALAGGGSANLIKTDANGVAGGVESGLAWVSSSVDTITLYRGANDPYWNYVRVIIWESK